MPPITLPRHWPLRLWFPFSCASFDLNPSLTLVVGSAPGWPKRNDSEFKTSSVLTHLAP
jgi:hypothetical protein